MEKIDFENLTETVFALFMTRFSQNRINFYFGCLFLVNLIFLFSHNFLYFIYLLFCLPINEEKREKEFFSSLFFQLQNFQMRELLFSVRDLVVSLALISQP